MTFSDQIKTLEALSTAMERSATVREKVRLADQIYDALSHCEQAVERFIVHELGGNASASAKTPRVVTPAQPAPGSPAATRFKGMTLADIGRIIIREHGPMHGAEIEILAKAGGFTGKAVKFQSYLAVAFKRDGGFKNLGRNVWDLVEHPDVEEL